MIVEGDGHICAQSPKGHKNLVKPIRAGIRRGQRIPVNRQLLIANAFENIPEQYMPTFHKDIRNFLNKETTVLIKLCFKTVGFFLYKTYF